MRTLPLRGQEVAPQAAKRAALPAVNQVADGRVESELTAFDKRVPCARARQKHEARIGAGHDLSSPPFSKYRQAAQDGGTAGPCLPVSS
jgi:hypothetical protein